MNAIPSIRSPESQNFNRLTPCIEIRDCVSRIVSFVAHFFMCVASSIVRFCNFVLDRDPVLEAAAGRLMNPEMKGWQRRHLIDKLKTVPTEDRALVVEQTLRLITLNTGFDGRLMLLKAVIAVPTEERASVVEQTLRIISESMDIDGKVTLLEAVTAVPAQERASVLEQTLRLIPHPEQVHVARFTKMILEAVKAVPTQEREFLIDQTLGLITDQIDSDDWKIIFDALNAVPQDMRANVIQNANQLFDPEMRAPARARIIEVLAFPGNRALENRHLEAQAREIIVEEHFLGQINDQFNRFGRIVIFDLVRIPREERERVVLLARNEDRMANRLDVVHNFVLPIDLEPPVQNNNPAMGFIDVHASNRDERTKYALELLRVHQGDISDNTIEVNVNAFIEYMAQAPLNPNQKEKALFALCAERGGNEPWGPLIDPDPMNAFTVNGLSISGSELIGRLWRFAESLNDVRDAQSSKQSMILALSTSYYEDGRRICNQGKTQRLVVAVLQGRLAGVRIDEVDIQVPTHVAVVMFFQIPDHQAIDKRDELLGAAEVFLRENPGVNRDPFLESINKYADETFDEDL